MTAILRRVMLLAMAAAGVVGLLGGIGAPAARAAQIAAQPAIRWSLVAEGLRGAPAVSGNTIVFSEGVDVRAVSRTTNQTLWRVRLGERTLSTPVIHDQLVYLTTADGFLHALDLNSGAGVWLIAIDAFTPAAPVVDGTALYAVGGEALFSLDAATGQKRWQTPTGVAAGFAPLVAGGVIYAGFDSGQFRALDAATGAAIWTFDGGERATWYTTPALANGTIYVGNRNQTLYALDAATGAQIWAFQARGWISTVPAVVGTTVYAGSRDGNLYALDTATGALTWATPTGGWVNDAKRLENGQLVVAVWTTGRPTSLFTQIDPATGAAGWSFTASGAADKVVVLEQGEAIFATDSMIYSVTI